MKGKRILITGASGFVGSHFVETALQRGFDVYAGIRKSSSRQYLLDPRINFVEIDMDQKKHLLESLKRADDEMGGFHHVIHNAGVTKPKRIHEFETGNADFTKFFAEAILETQSEFEKFVFLSSVAAQGPAEIHGAEALSESIGEKPVTPYGKSKLLGEKYLHGIHELNHLIFRPTVVYGPRDKKFILRIIELMLNGIDLRIGVKGQKLSFVYVKDLVDIILHSLLLDIERETYLISDGDSLPQENIFQHIKNELKARTIKIRVPKNLAIALGYVIYHFQTLLNIPVHISHHKMKTTTALNWSLDISKAKADLGYEPKFNLERGIRETIAWYQEKGLISR
jgi:nucleoside-diphosphate-sugar epimerase